MLMRYFFKKYKFTTDIFYKTIDHAIVEHKDNIFMVEIMPFFNYGGKYYIESVSKKDNERTIYSTKKSHGEKFDSENFEVQDEYFQWPLILAILFYILSFIATSTDKTHQLRSLKYIEDME